MALKNLYGWNGAVASDNGTAASFLQREKLVKQAKLATGTACGAGKPKPEPKPSACGSACGAGK